MYNGDSGSIVLVLQIEEKPPQITYQKHTLINNGTAGQ